MKVAVVVPLKSFALAKARLAGSLSPGQRRELAQRCADAVLGAAGSWPVYVVCESDDVDHWARERGARCVRADTSGAPTGLDAAVAAGVAAAACDGAEHVLIAHGDLPLARTFSHVPSPGAVSVVGDRRRDGTNVLSFPVASPMTTAYGPGSLARHRELARAAGLAVVEIDDPDLALDLDTTDDLEQLARLVPLAHLGIRTGSGSAHGNNGATGTPR